MTDTLLQSWLLTIATRPPAEWYSLDRLALADWLEERGDARAGTVRSEPERERMLRDLAELLRASFAAGAISGQQFMASLTCIVSADPIQWTPDATSRECHRLLDLFPEVTLEGPCPRHEPLPEGVSVVVQYQEEGLPPLTVPAGWCLWCGNRPRVAPAPSWLLDFASCSNVPPGHSWNWTSPAARRGVFSVTAQNPTSHAATLAMPRPEFLMLPPRHRPVCPAPAC